MARSFIHGLITLSEHLATVTEPGALASTTAEALVQALDCQSAKIWLLSERREKRGMARGRELLERVPLLGKRMPTLRPLSSRDAGDSLLLSGASGSENGSSQHERTVAGLTGGKVSTVAELVARDPSVLHMEDLSPAQCLHLLVGISYEDRPLGVLMCSWEGEAAQGDPHQWEQLLITLANYLGPVFGWMREEPAKAELYLAGIGVLLTALDTGPSATKECAEAVTQAVLQMATGKGLPPTELQALQWAALFHEVGRWPMEHWLTFPITERENASGDQGTGTPSSLAVVPGLAPAAGLLDRALAALESGNGSAAGSMSAAEQFLITSLTEHCRQVRSVVESEGSHTNGNSPQNAVKTEEPWDTTISVATSVPENVDTPLHPAA